jgi:hypothetical protein
MRKRPEASVLRVVLFFVAVVAVVCFFSLYFIQQQCTLYLFFVHKKV